MEIFSEQLLVIFLLQALAVAFTALLIPKLTVTGVSGPILMAIALAATNRFIWDPDLFTYLPTDLSLRTLVILGCNGLIFWILVKLLPGIEVDGILPALLAPVVFTVTSGVVVYYGKQVDWREVVHQGVQQVQQVRDSLQSSEEGS